MVMRLVLAEGIIIMGVRETRFWGVGATWRAWAVGKSSLGRPVLQIEQ